MAIVLRIYMEFSGEGNGWTDVTVDVYRPAEVDGSRGIHGQAPRDRVATTGVLSFALINSHANSGGVAGYYTPDGANQRAGFQKGIGVQARVLIGATEVELWTGTLHRVRAAVGAALERLTYCTCLDYQDKLARHRLRTLATAEAIDEHDVFSAIIAEMPVQPRAIEVQTGFDTYPYAFDLSRDESSAPMTELQRLTQSSLALVYPRGDGTLVYETRQNRALPGDPVVQLTAQDLLNGEVPDVEDDAIDIISHVQTIIAPRRVETGNVVLYRALSVPSFEVGGPFQVRGLYTDPAQRAIRAGGIDMVPAVATTDYTFNTQADGLGTDVTANVDVTTTFTSNAVVFGITNNYTAIVYATKLQARGIGLYAQERTILEDTDPASTDDNPLSFEMPYQADVTTAQEVAQYLRHVYGQKRKRVGAIPLMLTPWDEDRALLLARRDISDRFSFTETMSGLASAQFFINAVDFRLAADGTVWLYWTPAIADSTKFWHLGQVGFSELGQTTTLGFGYVVGHTDVAHGDSHTDQAHSDTTHVDTHTDTAHGDTGHGDTGHSDSHGDSAHVDTHSDTAHDDVAHGDVIHDDSHSDSVHGDVAHVDAAHNDSHSDTAHVDSHDDNAHVDTPSHVDGEDVQPHGDEEHFDSHSDDAHADSHSDAAHADSHTDNAHADGHDDTAHTDTAHSDVTHVDSHTDTVHADSHSDSAHTDAAHTDSAHADSHSDTSHADAAHEDSHEDSAHGDAN